MGSVGLINKNQAISFFTQENDTLTKILVFGDKNYLVH